MEQGGEMEASGSIAGESRSRPAKHKRRTDWAFLAPFVSAVVALYGAFGFAVYSLLTLVF